MSNFYEGLIVNEGLDGFLPRDLERKASEFYGKISKNLDFGEISKDLVEFNKLLSQFSDSRREKLRTILGREKIKSIEIYLEDIKYKVRGGEIDIGSRVYVSKPMKKGVGFDWINRYYKERNDNFPIGSEGIVRIIRKDDIKQVMVEFEERKEYFWTQKWEQTNGFPVHGINVRQNFGRYGLSEIDISLNQIDLFDEHRFKEEYKKLERLLGIEEMENE